MTKQKAPKAPPRCLICHEPVTEPTPVKSKPRKGPTLFFHLDCWEKEQEDLAREGGGKQ